MLILVRHGRTALNAAGRLQGRIDEPLDDVGRKQAAIVAEHVGPVDVLISSPLRRATETAEAFGVPFESDERWIELSYGIFEGVAIADTPSEAWDHWRQERELRAEWRRVPGPARSACPRRMRRARPARGRRRRRRRHPRVADQVGGCVGARRDDRHLVAITPVARLDLPHRHATRGTGAHSVQRNGVGLGLSGRDGSARTTLGEPIGHRDRLVGELDTQVEVRHEVARRRR